MSDTKENQAAEQSRDNTDQQIIDSCDTKVAKSNTPKGIVPVASQPGPPSSTESQVQSADDSQSQITDSKSESLFRI